MVKINEELLATNLALAATCSALRVNKTKKLYLMEDPSLNLTTEAQMIFDEYFEIYMDHIRVATIN